MSIYTSKLGNTLGQQKQSLGYLEIRSFPKIFMITVIGKEEISYDNNDSNRHVNGDRSHDFVFALCTMFTFLYISGFYQR